MVAQRAYRPGLSGTSGPPPERVASPEYAEQLLADALRTLKPSQAAGQVAKATGLDRKELYARALELRSE